MSMSWGEGGEVLLFCLFVYYPDLKNTGGDDGCHFNATISEKPTSILHFYSRSLTGESKVGPTEFPLRRCPAFA